MFVNMPESVSKAFLVGAAVPTIQIQLTYHKESLKQSLRIPEEYFDDIPRKSLSYIRIDDKNEQTYHLSECTTISFHSKSGHPIWTTDNENGPFTIVVPRGIGAQILGGEKLSAKEAEEIRSNTEQASSSDRPGR